MSAPQKQDYPCWQTGKADKAKVLIDSANYYRELYYAIGRARYSIFILGWDIDSRIELLRGDEAKGHKNPIRLFDLIVHKATKNPELNVYLNRWNYSFFMIREREPFSGWKWRFLTPSNVQYCDDDTLPFSACHHQKIVVIDDQIVFCGGMDITQERWDQRQHHVKAKERVDPGGMLDPFDKHVYGPYHDIQLMCTGPVVKGLAKLVRDRWKKGSGVQAIPVYEPEYYCSDYWFKHVKADFENIDAGIALTLPKTIDLPTVKEVFAAYLYEIAHAENIIYIENQYLSNTLIAEALNTQLKEKPALRVFIVTCDRPHGFLEKKSMWTGRVKFCDILGNGIEPSRYAVVYPVSKENGIEKTIHIHSKIMIVDDRFLHIGSANLNHRSMGFDSECDMIIEGKNEKSRQRIRAIRNNLIREHTGLEEVFIADTIEHTAKLEPLLQYQSHSRQHLKPIDNVPYRGQLLAHIAQKWGDPHEASAFTLLPVKKILCVLMVLVALIITLAIRYQPFLVEFFSHKKITDLIVSAHHSEWALLWVMGIYIFAGAIFFPVSVLNITAAIVFGPVKGILFALVGALSSASLGFLAGRLIGGRFFQFAKPVADKIRRYTGQGDILGMTVVRMIPLAPFTVVNITFGILGVSYINYILATIFGLMPGVVAKGILGGSLHELWMHPSPRVIITMIIGMLLWLGAIWLSQRVIYRYRQEHPS